MHGITIHFDGIEEERARERKRRTRAVFVSAIAFALLGGVIALESRAPEVRVVERIVPGVTTTIVETVTDTVIRYVTPPPPPREIDRQQPLIVARRFADLPAPGVEPFIRHLCVSPKSIHFAPDGKGRTEQITISNPGERPVQVARIAVRTDRARSGFVVDSAKCEARTLQPGESCTVGVTLERRIGETLQLLVYDDHSDHHEDVVVAAAEG